MPAYNTQPSLVPQRAIAENQLPNYSFGAKNPDVADTRMRISNTALATNVATYTVQMVEGNIPVPGQLVTVSGSTNGGTTFNVTNQPIVSVGTFSAAGVGTFTVAITHANIASAPDQGSAVAPVPETADALTGSAQAGLQFSVSRISSNRQGRNFTWAYSFPSAPGAAVIQLEGAINDVDAEYSILDKPTSAVLTSGGETRPLTTQINVNFVRVKVASSSGGSSPTVIAKILG